jgi:hypothetical protein
VVGLGGRGTGSEPSQPRPAVDVEPIDHVDLSRSTRAGFGNAREANNVRGIEIGTVVQLTFFGYTPAPSGMTRPNVNGTFIDGIGADPTAPVPQYVFNYPLPPLPTSLPIHDHRDNFNGGFAFSVYHPGTSLP